MDPLLQSFWLSTKQDGQDARIDIYLSVAGCQLVCKEMWNELGENLVLFNVGNLLESDLAAERCGEISSTLLWCGVVADQLCRLGRRASRWVPER